MTMSFDPANPVGLPMLEADDRRRLHAHVQVLAAQHELEWREVDAYWLGIENDLTARSFESPTLRTEFDYLTALHELGHFVLGLGTFDDTGTVVFENEIEVWAWTLAAALIDPGEAARAQVRLCFITYPDQTAAPAVFERLRVVAPPGGESEMRWRTPAGAPDAAPEPGSDR